MQKRIVYGLIGVMALGAGVVAHVQAAPTPTGMTSPATATATAPVNAKAEKQARLQEAVGKMRNGLQVRVATLESLATRIQTRIAKMELEGKDMTAAKAKLGEAQKAIALAKADMATLEKRIATMVASKNPVAEFAMVKRSVTLGAAAKIKSAHKALVDVIVIMKGQGGASGAATSTSVI